MLWGLRVRTRTESARIIRGLPTGQMEWVSRRRILEGI